MYFDYVQTYTCQYNANGQLSKLERENVGGLPALRYEFVYNADSDLTEVKLLENNQLYKRHIYSYNQPYAGEPVVDKDPFNPWVPSPFTSSYSARYLLDTHLNVFGSFRKHLIRSYKEEKYGKLTDNNVYYKYKLSANGYVTSQDYYDGVSNVHTITIAYNYQCPFVLAPNL